MATDRSNEARPVRILYTAQATVEGGRKGHGRTSDGRLEVSLSVPTELDGDGGPGTNPEQLFAVGYGACFHNALLTIARGRQLDMADSTITARVGFGPTGVGGFGLAVALDLHAPHVTRAEADDLMRRGHERCPYSRATRGNIDVTLSVDGTPVEQRGVPS
jgi:osmotically inducible protein OsmC